MYDEVRIKIQVCILQSFLVSHRESGRRWYQYDSGDPFLDFLLLVFFFNSQDVFVLIDGVASDLERVKKYQTRKKERKGGTQKGEGKDGVGEDRE